MSEDKNRGGEPPEAAQAPKAAPAPSRNGPLVAGRIVLLRLPNDATGRERRCPAIVVEAHLDGSADLHSFPGARGMRDIGHVAEWLWPAKAREGAAVGEWSWPPRG